MQWCKKKCSAVHHHQYPSDQARNEASRLAHLIFEQPASAEEWHDLLVEEVAA